MTEKPRKYRLENMKGGWFVGDFTPSVMQSSAVEVAYKTYESGQKELKHVHKIASEITLVASGAVLMNGVRYEAGDMIVIEAGRATDFEALEPTSTVVVKFPSVQGDKYVL